MITVGEPAPDFTLTGTRGQKVSLSDFLTVKRALLLFYPKTHTGCCGERLSSRTVTDLMDQLVALDTQPIGIAIDTTLTPRTFMAAVDLPFPFLVDPDKTAHAAYDALTRENGDPQRITVIVGKDGLVLHNQWGSLSREELLEILSTAQDDPISLAG